MKRKILIICSFIATLLAWACPLANAQKERLAESAEKSTLNTKFWGALVYASNNKVGKEVNKGLAMRLGKAFKKYKTFELLGQHTQDKVFRDYVNWIVPSDELNLEFESKGPADGGGMKVLLKLWQKKKVLVKSDAVIKPGKPLFFGRRGKTWIFGLPGNPASSSVLFEEFVRPVLRKMMGRRILEESMVKAILDVPITKTYKRQHFMRGILHVVNGEFRVRPLRFQGSHSIGSMVRSNALISVEADSQALPAGSKVSVRPLRNEIA